MSFLSYSSAIAFALAFPAFMPSPVLFSPFLLPETVASVGALGPVFQPSLAFHLVLYLVGQRDKEVYARDTFHLVYRVDILRLEPSAGVVAIDEAYAAWFSPQTYDDLEEGFGHCHLVLAYPLVRPEQILHRAGYTASYNHELRLPNWVAWHLTADHTNGPFKRKGRAFTEDEEVEEPRANTYDYSLCP